MVNTLTIEQVEQEHETNRIVWAQLITHNIEDAGMEDPDEYLTDEQIAAEILNLTGGF